MFAGRFWSSDQHHQKEWKSEHFLLKNILLWEETKITPMTSLISTTLWKGIAFSIWKETHCPALSSWNTRSYLSQEK